MANKEIPNLTSASTLDGTEVMHVVQGGNSRKTTGAAIVGISHNQAWSTITSAPTTLSGYGITDAATSAQGAKADTALQPGYISALTEDTAPNWRTDFLAEYDISVSADRKATLANAVKQASALVALTDGATIALDWTSGVTFSVTLAGNRTLSNPTNGEPGTWRTVIITQDATGSRTLAFDTDYKFPGGTAPTLSTAAAAVDVLSILCVSSTLFYVFSGLNLS